MFLAQPTKRWLVASVVCSSLSAVSWSALAAKQVTSIEGITEYHLDNGLQVLLFPDQTKETVTVNVTYHVGSKHENYGETGMAHLLEHLVFKGTPRHKDIPAELSSHGARPNGTTWTDRTNYFETFTASPENINWALDMEADRMVNSFIAKKDLDSEMTVVRNEFERGENSPFRVTLQRTLASAFEWHNYGKSTIGARSDLENVSIDRLKAFYKKYYQPDNATLIVAGKFENDSMIKLIDKYFGVIPKPTRVIEPLYTKDPAQDGEREVTVRRVGDVQLVGSVYKVPAGSHEDFAALDVAAEIFGAAATGRLHKALVENKLASRAFGFNFQWEEPGVALYFAQVDKDQDLAVTEAELIKTLEKTMATPFTDDEVERAKRTILKDIELTFNSSERIALGLSEWVGMGDWRLLFLNRDRIEQVTTADVQRVVDTYFVQNNRTVGRYIPTDKPERVEIPQVESVAAMLEGYKGRENIAQGEAFDPSHDNIDSRTKMLTLDNGIKVALLAKKTRGESVVVNVATQMGDLDSLQSKGLVGELTGSMLMRGTTKYTREQLKDEFDKLKTNARIGGDVEGASARLETVKANLVPALKLMAQVLQQPSFDAKEFDQLVSTTEVDIEQQLQDPQAIVFREFSRRQSPFDASHPRYIATMEEELANLKTVKLADLQAFHKQFYSANSMQVSVVGDFDERVVVKTLNELFGKWSSDQAYQRITHPYHQQPSKDQTFNTPDKENAVFVASTTLPVGVNSKDAPALELANYIFGGGFLNSRLATRLRQKDGLSYGAGSFVRMSSSDARASMGAYAICAPQNLAKVEVGFKEELARLIKDGFTAEEVEAAKSGLLQGKRVSRSQDRELVGKLNGNLYYNKTMQFDKKYEKQLASLTPEQLHKVVKKYFKLKDFSIIKGGDMSKVE
ncbi:insulinase family protein [Thalassotalea euphylliae]|uniref:Insulinase family protein n=1 Tax=Thalassotalea euphylliae TaxID=1655234 RepID=A0A3E0TNY6_9GAMM|nr:pitrilysin family protein [Thalassotalea euphylliae]REL25705.1 insulinase family protein [Thalassotalea euphylliae]